VTFYFSVAIKLLLTVTNYFCISIPLTKLLLTSLTYSMMIMVKFCDSQCFVLLACSALMLLAGCKEWHPACKSTTCDLGNSSSFGDLV